MCVRITFIPGVLKIVLEMKRSFHFSCVLFVWALHKVLVFFIFNGEPASIIGVACDTPCYSSI